MRLAHLLPIRRTEINTWVLNNELTLLILLTLVTSVIVLSQVQALAPARAFLGILCVVFFPGYALLALLFPTKGPIEWLERVALSVGVSIAIIPPLAYLLDILPWGFTLLPMLISITAVIVVASIGALILRHNVPDEERFFSQLTLLSGGTGFLPISPKLGLALGALCALALSFGLYLNLASRNTDYFTGFYVLGDSGLAQGYPKELEVGLPFSFVVGLDNNERADMKYSVVAKVGDQELGGARDVLIERGSSVQVPIEVTPSTPQEDAKIEFLLFKAEDAAPYRSVHLWTNIKNKGVSR